MAVLSASRSDGIWLVLFYRQRRGASMFETRRSIQQNAAMLRASQRRVALFWERRRVPWPGMSGGAADPEQDRLRDSVRARLLSSELFRLSSSKVWAGFGNGTRACVVCKEVIQALEIEYEPVDVPAGLSAILVHLRCLTLWNAESDALSQPAA